MVAVVVVRERKGPRRYALVWSGAPNLNCRDEEIDESRSISDEDAAGKNI
jgi:hypothetical protein